MRGRHKLIDVQGEPARYIKATLRLEEWNGSGSRVLTPHQRLTDKQIARMTVEWVAEQLARWTVASKKRRRAA